MNKNLDCLRAIAVLSVLTNHILSTALGDSSANAWFGYLGRLGVLFFFVHTSLVLMESMERHGRHRGWINVFYIRRAFRIYPLPIVCLSVILALHIPAAPLATCHGRDWATIADNYLLIQNFFAAGHNNSILAPLWSLPYEIQMYLILPVFLILSDMCKGLKSWVRYIQVVGLVVLSLGVARLNYVWPKSLPELLSYYPCFMGGIVAWQLMKNVVPRFPSQTFLPAVLALLGGYVFWAAPRNDMRFQWLLCLLLGCMLPFFQQIHNRWLVQWCARIAKYCYGIYLAHDPLLWLTYTKLPISPRWSFVVFIALIASVAGCTL